MHIFCFKKGAIGYTLIMKHISGGAFSLSVYLYINVLSGGSSILFCCCFFIMFLQLLAEILDQSQFTGYSTLLLIQVVNSMVITSLHG